MKKINIIKENREFNRIIKNNKSYNTRYYFIYKEETNENIYKFGISVSKKIGNAVIRNLYKRRIRCIISKNKYRNNFNCIIILKKSVLEVPYIELEKVLNDAFNNLNLIKE